MGALSCPGLGQLRGGSLINELLAYSGAVNIVQGVRVNAFLAQFG
jgi:hypothetical protein